MKKLLVLLSVGVLALFGCKGEIQKVTIAGSTTVLPIAQATAESFMQVQADVDVSVRGGGSSVGIAGIIEKTVDIGNASRLAKGKELKKASADGVKLVKHIVAFDGIAIVVDKANQIGQISLSDLRDIYSGKITNWKELGGVDKQIVVVNRDASSGTFETFDKKVMNKQKVMASSLNLGSNNAVVSSVGSTPGAVGYIGYGYINDKVNVLVVDGVVISKDAIKSGAYPISRSLQMYTGGEPQGMVKCYLDFVKSSAGQKIVAKQGFVEIN